MATEWERIVRDHGPLVYGTAWRILGQAADAEDVVQEVFIEANRIRLTRPGAANGPAYFADWPLAGLSTGSANERHSRRLVIPNCTIRPKIPRKSPLAGSWPTVYGNRSPSCRRAKRPCFACVIWKICPISGSPKF